MEREFILHEESFEPGEEFAPENGGKDFDGEKEMLGGVNPG